jgi:murein DD-endopeptidase / murein LD-carboxypeptidase
LKINLLKISYKIVFEVIALILLFYMTSCTSSRNLPNYNTRKNNLKEENIKRKEFYVKYSERLKIKLTGNENRDLILFIDKWMGTPYKYGGNTLRGTDCSGLAGNLYSDVYKTKISRTVKSIYLESIPVDKAKLKEGDFVFFKIESKDPNHIGIYISNNKFVHASIRKGVFISDLNEDYFKKYYFSGGKLKK